MTPDDPRHGTYAGVQQHRKDGETCCEPCRTANARYFKRMKYRLHTEGHERTTLGKEAWTVIDGMGRRELSRLTGIRDSQLSRFHAAGPTIGVYRRTRDKILAAHPAATPIGLQRRLQALYALGYSTARMAKESGLSVESLTKHMQGERAFRRPGTVQAILDLYRTYAYALPPESTRSVSMVRNLARHRRYAPPLAWDDIDNDAEPKGMKCSVKECDRESSRRGWCEMHYRRWSRSGDPEGTGKTGRPRGVATYAAIHRRLKTDRGLAKSHTCPCGSQAATWSYDHSAPDEMYDSKGRPFSGDLEHYQPLCVSCHNRRDKAAKRERVSRPDIDPQVVERILHGDVVPANRAEREEVVRRWRQSGRPMNELERMTGWKVARYDNREDVA